MDIITPLQYTFGKVLETFSHNWFLLLISIVISATLKLYVDQEAIARFLRRNTKNSVLMSTGVAVATPLCSCGTTAVVLGMMASTVPWAPIVAFMVASPLTSPQELVYSAGLFGWPFAITFFVSSILLGLLGGAAAGLFESKGWLANQSRFAAAGTPARPVERPAPVRASLLERSPHVGQNRASQRLQFTGIGLGQPAALAWSRRPPMGCVPASRDYAVAVAAPVMAPVAAPASACGCASTAQTA